MTSKKYRARLLKECNSICFKKTIALKVKFWNYCIEHFLKLNFNRKFRELDLS